MFCREGQRCKLRGRQGGKGRGGEAGVMRVRVGDGNEYPAVCAADMHTQTASLYPLLCPTLKQPLSITRKQPLTIPCCVPGRSLSLPSLPLSLSVPAPGKEPWRWHLQPNQSYSLRRPSHSTNSSRPQPSPFPVHFSVMHASAHA